MSTATMKKMAIPRGGTPDSSSAMGRDSSRPRSSTPTGSATPASARPRSMRQSASISARGAARQSPLGGAASSVGSTGSSSSDSSTAAAAAAAAQAEEDARAEATARIQDLQDRLAAADADKEHMSKQADMLQTRLYEATRESARLEEKAHECEEQLEALELEKRDLSKQVREMGSIYEAERCAMIKEKDDMANREEELQAVIQRLKDTLAQRATPVQVEDDVRSSRQDPDALSITSESFAPPSSIHRSESRSNSKLLFQKDKLIEQLRLDLAEAQIKLVESENQGNGRLQELESQLMKVNVENARLIEDNESYQLLLQEKTLAGDFTKSDFASYLGRGSHQDALNALEGRTSQVGDDANSDIGNAVPDFDGAAAAATTATTTTTTTTTSASCLADELSDAAEIEIENFRRLEAELRNVKEQNKALSLYINKIIERLLKNGDFEHILDQSGDGAPKPAPNTNKDLPLPPSQQPNIFQRKFMSGNATAATATSTATTINTAAAAASTAAPASTTPTSTSAPKLRPRPLTFMPTPASNSAHTDPERAPSIPIGNLGRAASVRRARPMSEQFTSSGAAASLVSQMYNGPASPPLGPARSQSFFSPGGVGNPNAAARHPSGHGPGHRYSNSGHSVSGAFPRSSDASSTASGDSGDVATISSPGHSPSRASSIHSATTFAGNKPRPLRLVQENSDAVKAEANKRASWMPWANWGNKKEDVAGSPIRE